MNWTLDRAATDSKRGNKTEQSTKKSKTKRNSATEEIARDARSFKVTQGHPLLTCHPGLINF